MDVEAEIRELKRRVGELEGGFGFLINQVRDVHRDLLGFQSQTGARFDKVDGRLDRVEAEVRGLREDLPSIVGGAVREAMRQRG